MVLRFAFDHQNQWCLNHFLLPAVFVFVLVGEFVNVSVSVFVFVDVPLLVALFVMVGLLVLEIPRVFMVSRKYD